MFVPHNFHSPLFIIFFRENFMHYPIRILFLCTGNSARSQMAEGFLRHYGGKDFAVDSAGTNPSQINPLAIKVMAENKIDISQQYSKDVTELIGKSFDFVITLCDNAREHCPTFFNDAGETIQTIHWRYPDPAAVEGDEANRLREFRKLAVEMRERIRLLVTVDRKQLQERGIPVDL
jgi:arsenate reductase